MNRHARLPGRDDDGTLAARVRTEFNRLFEVPFRVRMEGGADEPEYRPGCDGAPARLRHREDFARSALHEAAHWCIAGAARRRLPDFGYWYVPAGRNASAQRAFLAAEVRPQAIERVFCEALGLAFDVSVDDPGNEPPDIDRFRRAVAMRAAHECAGALPPRAARLRQALAAIRLRCP